MIWCHRSRPCLVPKARWLRECGVPEPSRGCQSSPSWFVSVREGCARLVNKLLIAHPPRYRTGEQNDRPVRCFEMGPRDGDAPSPCREMGYHCAAAQCQSSQHRWRCGDSWRFTSRSGWVPLRTIAPRECRGPEVRTCPAQGAPDFFRPVPKRDGSGKVGRAEPSRMFVSRAPSLGLARHANSCSLAVSTG